MTKENIVVELFLGIEADKPVWIFYETLNFKSKKIRMKNI